MSWRWVFGGAAFFSPHMNYANALVGCFESSERDSQRSISASNHESDFIETVYTKKRPVDHFPALQKKKSMKECATNQSATCVDSLIPELIQDRGWNQYPLKHLWNLGYQPFPMIRILEALPTRPRLAFKQISDVLHGIAIKSIIKLESARSLSVLEDIASEIERIQPKQPDMYKDFFMNRPDVAKIWDKEQHFGLIRTSFDPETQIRQCIDANSRAAEFWGLTKADFIYRCRQSNLHYLMSELDWLRAIAAYLARFFDDSLVQYVRLSTGFGGPLQHCLARITTLKTLDSQGRITQVIPLFSDSKSTKNSVASN